MNATRAAPDDRPPPGQYEIRLRGHLDARWSDWFDGLTLTLDDSGDSLLTGPIADQAALHGLLRKVRDQSLPLLSVRRVEPDQPELPTSESR